MIRAISFRPCLFRGSNCATSIFSLCLSHFSVSFFSLTFPHVARWLQPLQPLYSLLDPSRRRQHLPPLGSLSQLSWHLNVMTCHILISKPIRVTRGISLRLARTEERDTVETGSRVSITGMIQTQQRMERPSTKFRTVTSRPCESERIQVWSFYAPSCAQVEHKVEANIVGTAEPREREYLELFLKLSLVLYIIIIVFLN